MSRVKISDVSKVTKKKATTGTKPSNVVGQGEGTPSNVPMSGDTDKQPPKPSGMQKEKKRGPGKIVLRDEEKFPDEFIDKIRQAIEKPEDWDIGKVGIAGEPVDGDFSSSGGTPGQSPQKDIEDREWGEMPEDPPENIEKKIDQAIKEAQRRAVKKQREEKTNAQKTKGGNTGGGFRDRVMLQEISQTDWAKIFESRLTEYSREKAKQLPYTRRLSGGPLGRTLPSNIESKDVLPETCITIDTSSSLSYLEMKTILGELKKALISAKISIANIILWESEPYWYKSYDDITIDTFEQILNDIQKNWKGGGNNIRKVYELMIDKGWTRKFNIHLTDGWIRDHRKGETRKLSYIVNDPANCIFGIIYPTQRIKWNEYMRTADMFPGEKVPIFLDTSKFGL